MTLAKRLGRLPVLREVPLPVGLAAFLGCAAGLWYLGVVLIRLGKWLFLSQPIYQDDLVGYVFLAVLAMLIVASSVALWRRARIGWVAHLVLAGYMIGKPILLVCLRGSRGLEPNDLSRGLIEIVIVALLLLPVTRAWIRGGGESTREPTRRRARITPSETTDN